MPGVRNQAIPRTRFLFAALSSFKNEENARRIASLHTISKAKAVRREIMFNFTAKDEKFASQIFT